MLELALFGLVLVATSDAAIVAFVARVGVVATTHARGLYHWVATCAVYTVLDYLIIRHPSIALCA